MRCSRCARGEVKGSKVSIDERGVQLFLRTEYSARYKLQLSDVRRGTTGTVCSVCCAVCAVLVFYIY